MALFGDKGQFTRCIHTLCVRQRPQFQWRNFLLCFCVLMLFEVLLIFFKFYAIIFQNISDFYWLAVSIVSKMSIYLFDCLKWIWILFSQFHGSENLHVSTIGVCIVSSPKGLCFIHLHILSTFMLRWIRQNHSTLREVKMPRSSTGIQRPFHRSLLFL